MKRMADSISAWREADGDNTFALDWPINDLSRVWEIGGYEGRWAAQIWDKFHCHITVFEPQLWAVEKMQRRFAGIGKIDIRPYGLMNSQGDNRVWNIGNDGASLFDYNHGESAILNFHNWYWELMAYGRKVDLCLMNIEGAEFELLPNMLVNDAFLHQIDYFWCQFHPGIMKAEQNQVDFIYTKFSESHNIIWDFYPTAVAWERRSPRHERTVEISVVAI